MSEDKKNENEKLVKYITGKLKQGQIILMIECVSLFGKSSPNEAKLAITSNCLYFLSSLSIKKYFKATAIECIIVTPYSNEMVIFYDAKGDHSQKESVRFQSHCNVKIVQHILIVREKFHGQTEKLMTMIHSSKSLQNAANMESNNTKSKIFGFLFRKKDDPAQIQQRLSGQSEVLFVCSNDFAIQIGQKMYNQTYKSVKLLYINTNQTFRFEEEKYLSEDLTAHIKIFRPKKQQMKKSSSESHFRKCDSNKNIFLRKIGKTTPDSDKKLSSHLQKYRNEQYKQQLIYALETETHFEVITGLFQDERNCQQILQDYEYLSEKDLRSIFFKIIGMIQNTHVIFYSLNPENIIMGPEGVKISQVFSCLIKRVEVDYIAPQELCQDNFTNHQIQAINLWKAGILMFELAYGNVPFPAEYIAQKIINGQNEIQLNFPNYLMRTLEFQQFLKSILQLNPQKRGSSFTKEDFGLPFWKKRIMKDTWLRNR